MSAVIPSLPPTGWVCRPGHYFSTTHHLAATLLDEDESASQPFEGELDRGYEGFPVRAWDGTTPISILDEDIVFWNRSELDEYCKVAGFSPDELRLVHCDPVYGTPLGDLP